MSQAERAVEPLSDEYIDLMTYHVQPSVHKLARELQALRAVVREVLRFYGWPQALSEADTERLSSLLPAAEGERT